MPRKQVAALLGSVFISAMSVVARADNDPDDEEALQTIVVSATRSSSLIGDDPFPAQTVPAGEIEENSTVQPGNLTSLLHELPSVRIQYSAAALGGAGMQLRGMPARDTLVLTDGLPLLGAEPDAFGLVQTPPLDLERVEVIKGAASALYGSAALGGVLNLVSRKADSPSAVLGNATSRGGQDLVGFFTRNTWPWSATLTAGAHHQAREDVSEEGWADVPGYQRYTLQPRLWWGDSFGRSLFFTAGLVDEERIGGTLRGRTLADGETFPVELRTHRWNVGAVSHLPLAGDDALSGRFSVTSDRLDQTFGAQRIPSTHTTAFGEETWNGTAHGHHWVLGAAFEHDQLSVDRVSGVGYTYNVPALFAQDSVPVSPWLVVAGSGRVDVDNAYGTFFSPRLSTLFRQPGSDWSVRASIAGGYSGPTPFLDEIESTSLGSVLPLRGLHAERAVTESLDAQWADEGWTVNASVFASDIREPLEVLPVGGKLEIINAAGPQRAPGAEALIGYVVGPLQTIASFSHINATQSSPAGGREYVPLVARNAGSLDAILESEERGRLGLEIDYTGKQGLEYDPYRGISRAYVTLNALAELRFKSFSLFFNAINLSNVRQTHWDPLIRPTPGPGGNPITEAWAPLAGRTLNLGFRIQ